MIKKSFLAAFIFCSSIAVFAKPQVFKADSLLSILKRQDKNEGKRDLILYIRSAFGDMPEKDLESAKNHVSKLLRSSHVPDSEGLNFFIDAICQIRHKNYTATQGLLVQAIERAGRSDDHYLLYACFTHLAFLRTDQGDVIGAISSYRAAKKEATLLDDAYLQVLIDINLSDIYYRNGMSDQALIYLSEAQSLVEADHIENQRMKNSINYNKAEVYFQTKNNDSLKKYNALLHKASDVSKGLYTFKKRTDYYIAFLEQRYDEVINVIKSLGNDSLYEFKVADKCCLADAYFQSGLLDSAKSIVKDLIADTNWRNRAELNLHLYKVLGDIESREGDYKNASGSYNLAMSQTLEQLKRLISVGSVSSQIQIDQIQNGYALHTEKYKRERLWLLFIISVVTLVIVIGALLYYNTRRKKYYEKLLFDSQKKEIAFINSHEVRRHASNIMGIMQLINQADQKYENFIEAEDYLLSELGSLDQAIRNISEKLNS